MRITLQQIIMEDILTNHQGLFPEIIEQISLDVRLGYSFN
jgi:hypothetical protein